MKKMAEGLGMFLVVVLLFLFAGITTFIRLNGRPAAMAVPAISTPQYQVQPNQHALTLSPEEIGSNGALDIFLSNLPKGTAGCNIHGWRVAGLERWTCGVLTLEIRQLETTTRVSVVYQPDSLPRTIHINFSRKAKSTPPFVVASW